MWPWSKKTAPQPSVEATLAAEIGQQQLSLVRALRAEASDVHTAAAESLARNNYGNALTAAMTGRMKP